MEMYEENNKEKPEGRIERGIGFGRIEVTDFGEPLYQGTVPFQRGDEVCIIKKELLELLCEKETELLRAHEYELPEYMYSHSLTIGDQQECAGCMHLPDEMFYIPAQTEHIQEPFKLFLDRTVYSFNPRDEIWVRYVNVDVSLSEEDLDEE